MKEKEMERVLKALANRRRLAIIKFIKKEKEASVGDVAGEIKLSFKSTSKHLALLAAADILEKEQRSSQMFYRLAGNFPETIKHLSQFF
ncbi:MAG: metalloregulator ArsR/SmtB family transcription factor [Patescibacteria group bacterium]